MQLRSVLEKASWAAAIAAAAFGLVQLFLNNGYDFKGAQGPVIITQQSGQTTVIVNAPPPRLASDQENCPAGEKWVGFNPNEAEFAGTVPENLFPSTVFQGKFRWSPSSNGMRNTSKGEIAILIDGKKSLIHRWDAPDASVHEFSVPLGAAFFDKSSGNFKIVWTYTNGSSGICVAKNIVAA